MPAHSRSFSNWFAPNPGKFNAAAASGLADFLMMGFLKSNNLDMAKVPYRDIMQGPNDLAENRIQLLSSSLAIVTPLMQAGKIKVLAVTGRKRAPSAPDVPTVREAGYPALEMDSIRRHRSGRAACRSHARADRRRRPRGDRERSEHRREAEVHRPDRRRTRARPSSRPASRS